MPLLRRSHFGTNPPLLAKKLNNSNNFVTVIIPTKNRPDDLKKAVESILAQSTLPDELLLVDQSDNESSKTLIRDLTRDRTDLIVTYIYDQTINGLVAAKDCGSRIAKGSLICFLEDDVVLDPYYLEALSRGFIELPSMIGCCGVITNHPTRSTISKFIFNIFHLGIFFDPRPKVFEEYSDLGDKLIASRMISGGLSAWRCDVFKSVPFDVDSGFHLFEDIEFSTRVADRYGDQLYINPLARLEHHCSRINRDAIGPGQQRKVVECFKFYNKRRSEQFALSSFLWLLVGLFFDSLAKSLSRKTLDPIKGYFGGIVKGIS